MPSIYEDPSTWRLQFPSGDGFDPIPARIVSREGTFERDVITVKEVYLMRAAALLAFASDTFPPPYEQDGKIVQPSPRHVPGPWLKNVVASKITWEGHVPGVPVDPFVADESADSGTYQDFVSVTVEYTTDRDDDEFMTITANASGEVIFLPVPKAEWEQTPGGDTEQSRQPGIGHNKLVPMTQWTVRFPNMPYTYYRDTYINTVRDLLGKINSVHMPELFDAAPETILFIGHELIQDFVWRSNHPKMARITLKFLEKRIFDSDATWQEQYYSDNPKGHNYFWNPDTGKYQKLLFLPDSQPAFELDDLRTLFVFEDSDEPPDDIVDRVVDSQASGAIEQAQ